MYYDSLNKLIFIILASTVPVSYIVFRIKPNLLHFKVLENNKTKTIAKVIFSITLFLLLIKLILEMCWMSIDYFFLEIFEPYYYTTLVILLTLSICVLKLKIPRIILNIVFLVSGILWLLGRQHQFYLYQIYTLTSLNAAIIGINMYPYKSNNNRLKDILDIILIWIAIIIFSFIYQEPCM